MELRALKEAGTSLAQSEHGIASSPEASVSALTTRLPRRSILVDATAADTQPLLEIALQRGFDLVLANKLPLAGAQAAFDRLHNIAESRSRRVAHEATVGAGLPVIDTISAPMRLTLGKMRISSSVSPEFEIARTTSPRTSMPRSP